MCPNLNITKFFKKVNKICHTFFISTYINNERWLNMKKFKHGTFNCEVVEEVGNYSIVKVQSCDEIFYIKTLLHWFDDEDAIFYDYEEVNYGHKEKNRN